MATGFFILIFLVFLVVAGAIAAPLSGLVCALVGHLRKLRSWDFALAGVVFGAFVFPWPYVLWRAYGRSLPIGAMVIIYFLAYAIWACAAISVVLGNLGIWEYTLGTSTGFVAPDASVRSAIAISILHAGWLAIFGFAMLRSVKGLSATYTSERRNPLESLFDASYLKPFAHAYIWLIAALVVALINAQFLAGIGVDIIGF